MTQYLGNLTYNIVTIPSGQTTSNAIDLQGLNLVQIIMPSAFTGTAINFQSSFNNGTYSTLYDNSNIIIGITVNASRAYNINPIDFTGCRYFKIVSNGTEAGDRVIGLVTREDTLCHF